MTATTPKTKPYTLAADYGYAHQHHQQERKPPAKGDYVPVYVEVGMIALSMGHTAWLQLSSPTVRVKKERRETLPEVVEPEHMAEEAEKNLKGSFFMKVAHVQDKNPDQHILPDPIRNDAFAHSPKIETLKSVGVDTSQL